MANDIVTLSVPREGRAAEIVELIVGGVASRFGLGVDRLDDLRLALDAVFEDEQDGAPLIIQIGTGSGFEICLGPIDGSVRRRLDEEEGTLALRHVLGTLVDRVDVVERDGADWLVLTQTASASRAS
jgi:hypothetical protein